MVQRPRENSSVTVTSASGATIPKVESICSKSCRLPDELAMLSASSPCSMSARPLSAASASSVTTSILEGLPIHAEHQILVGRKLAVEHDRTVGERALGAGVEIVLRYLHVAQPRRQLHARDHVGHRFGGLQPGRL